MDFFQAQDRARRKSGLLVFYFVAAVVSIVTVIYMVSVVLVTMMNDPDGVAPLRWWRPDVLAIAAPATLAIIAAGTFFKTVALRGGGGTVARSLGGTRIEPSTGDMARRRLMHVVEEMAIASGVRVPEVYVLPEEGINAFAAGFSSDDAAVAVTQGALDTLSRDELQGVVAHEFSHILNGDMRLNIRLIGLLFGILLLAIIGRVVVRSLRFSRSSRSKNSGGVIAAIFIVGLTLMLVGYIGVLFGRLIQAAVSRQREYLADAAAVQFTRNPSGIAGALKRIGAAASAGRVANAHTTESSHLFFANPLSGSAFNLFATHPPLVERIRAIEPDFDGNFASARQRPAAAVPPPVPAARRMPPPLRPGQFAAAIAALGTAAPATGAAIVAAIPESLRDAAHDPERARAVVLALLANPPGDAAAEARQSAALAGVLTRTEIEAGAGLAPLVRSLDPEARFALLDLALPALRELPAEGVTALLAAVDGMIRADSRVTPFEFAIQHVVRRHLRAPGRVGAPAAPAGHVARALTEDVVAVLASVAGAGSAEPHAVEEAFAAGAKHFGLLDQRLDPGSSPRSGLMQLGTALERLDWIPPRDKKRLIEALAIAASADRTIHPDEAALVRAFAAALDCPAPPLASTER